MNKNFIKKPWGSEELISNNKNYVLKRLFMKKGHRCSLQYHKKKHETVSEQFSKKSKTLYSTLTWKVYRS